MWWSVLSSITSFWASNFTFDHQRRVRSFQVPQLHHFVLSFKVYIWSTKEGEIIKGGWGHSKFLSSITSFWASNFTFDQQRRVKSFQVPQLHNFVLSSKLYIWSTKKGEVIPSSSAPSLRSELQPLHVISKRGEAIPSF